MNLNYVRQMLRWVIVILWMPVAAFAATPAMTVALSGLSLLTVAFIMMLSTVSGLTALVWKVDRALKKGANGLPRPVLFACGHMLGSWFAGFMIFAICESGNTPMNGWLEVLSVICASFLGATFVEWVLELFAKSIGMPLPKDEK